MDGNITPMEGRPSLLLVYGDSGFAAKCSRHFRRQGWEFHLGMPHEAVRMVERLTPTVVVVDGEALGADASRAAAQIAERRPGQFIVLLAGEGYFAEPFAESVRVTQRTSIDGLAHELLCTSNVI